MSNKTLPSIRRQLLTITISLMLIITLFTYIIANNYSKSAARLSYDRLLASAALQIFENTHIDHNEIIVDLPSATFETLSMASTDRLVYQITQNDDEHLTGYKGLYAVINNKAGTSWQRSEYDPRDNLEIKFWEGDYKGENFRFILLSDKLYEVGKAFDINILIGQTTQARDKLAYEMNLKVLQMVTLIFVIAIVLILLGVRQILQPIYAINNKIRRRSPMDLRPIDMDIPKEMADLITTINHFMIQLEVSLNHLKRFTGEVAHQIRTPLAGLKSQAQNAIEESDTKIRTEQLKRVLYSTDLLDSTVTQLLNQATLAHRFHSQPFITLSLPELVKSVCRDVAVSAIQRGVIITYQGDENLMIEGDAFALSQMLRNILENAIKFSPTDKEINVSTELHSTELGFIARLNVADQGVGVPNSEKQHVFERFYKSKGDPRAGSGLGLSIAKEVAEHHNASIQLLDNIPSGLIFEINFKLTLTEGEE
jgi:two-component system sensor histidine kinase TctE